MSRQGIECCNILYANYAVQKNSIRDDQLVLKLNSLILSVEKISNLISIISHFLKNQIKGFFSV